MESPKEGEIDRERPYCLDDYRSLVELWREANDFNTYKLTRRGAFANVVLK